MNLLSIAKSYYRSLGSVIIFMRLKSGMYKRVKLPEYNFGDLLSKWPYNKPCCVSDDFHNTPYDGHTNLSIIVPLYNSSSFIERLYSQLMSQNTEYTYEVIFVNDGSSDNTDEKLRSLCRVGA